MYGAYKHTRYSHVYVVLQTVPFRELPGVAFIKTIKQQHDTTKHRV